MSLQGLLGAGFYLACSERLCKEGNVGSTLPQRDALTPNGNCVKATLGKGILKNYHIIGGCRRLYREILAGMGV